MNENRDDTNKPIADDWAMSEPQTLKTEPENAKSDGWKMPEPVFRVSDGTSFSSPKKETPPLSQPTPAASAQIVTENSLPGIDIQPQPFLPEELNVNQTIKEKAVETKSGVPKVVFGVFGILAMILFALAFVVGVYFLFFYKSYE